MMDFGKILINISSRMWDLFKANCLKTIVLEKSPGINQVKFLPSMNHLLISSLNNQIQAMDFIDEQEIVKYTGHSNSKHLIDVSYMDYEDDIILYSGSEDGCVYLWNVQDGGEGFKLQIPRENIQEKGIINCVTNNKEGIVACAGFPDYNNDIFLYKIKK